MANLSELLEAAQTAPVESENFYRQRNEAFVQIAVEANANTPESQIEAQEKELAVVQQRNVQSLSMLMEAQAKDMQAYEGYKEEYVGRKADYDMLRDQRLQNLRQLTEEETDPSKNNIFLSPRKTIASMFRSRQLKDQNNAIANEMNALGDEMSSATKDWIATHTHNQQQLAFNLQTEVELKSQNALLAARQAQGAAALRYNDKQDDIAKLTTATAGITPLSASAEATRAGKANTLPTRAEAAYYYAQKTKTPYNPTMPDELYNQVVRAYKSEPEPVQNANAQSFIKYDQYIKTGAGSTETPTSFAAREITSSTDSAYAKALDTLNEGRFSEVAAIGLELQVQKVAASLRTGSMQGLTPEQMKNPVIMKQLTAAQNIADETAQQIAVKAALEGSFKESLDGGIEYMQADMAGIVSDATITDPRPYANPAKVSAVLTNPDFLLANIPPQYLEGKDPLVIKTEADVVAKVSGMNGGDPQAHKFLAANEFLKKQGITGEYERVNILQKWLQLSLKSAYAQQGAYASLAPLAQETVAARGEDFLIPVTTRPIKATATLFGSNIPAIPEVDLSSLSGFAVYMKAIESGVLQESQRAAKRREFDSKILLNANTLGTLPNQ
jgi:hypothetical protein